MQELNHRLVEKPEDVAAACEELSRRGEVGFDTETTSLSPFEGRVRLVQLASTESVYVFDLDRLAPDGEAARAESLEPLRRLLAATRPVKVAHNCLAGDMLVSMADGTISRLSDEPVFAPNITSSPQGQTVLAGSNCTLHVTASGSAFPTAHSN